MLDHRLAGESSESFSWIPGGGKSGGDDTQNPRPHI
jgi:hypothetical protein